MPVTDMDFSFLDSGVHTGAWNMDFDVQYANRVDAGQAKPLLRVYQWDPWCISLGRHQKESEIDTARTNQDGIDLVRRPTGGRAILHAEELTYSIIYPSEGKGIMEVYKEISEALSAGLRTFAPEVAMARSQPNFQKLYREPGSIPCFSSSARYEIEFGGKKLVGSAQRRIGGTVLQHGSILIDKAHLGLTKYVVLSDEARAAMHNDLIQQTTTLNEVTGKQIDPKDVATAVRTGFEQAWGITFNDSALSAYVELFAEHV
ncbi:MAG: ligase [Ectothiorhodospiraceae bacterium]|nr:ligase [Ectothiorhodospiraceae bacterium]